MNIGLIKECIDEMADAVPKYSWLDANYRGNAPVYMPGTKIPALRYTFVPRGKMKQKFYRIIEARDALQARLDNRVIGFELNVIEHFTVSLSRHRPNYWKVEVYIPIEAVVEYA